MLVIKITLGADAFVFKGKHDHLDTARDLLNQWYLERARKPPIHGTLVFDAPTEQAAP